MYTTQFSRLDAAVTALKRVQINLKRYRAAVLRAACEGRLVPTEAELARQEGRDYEPADVLLQRILCERRARWEAEQLTKMEAQGRLPLNDTWKAKYQKPNGSKVLSLPMLPQGWCWTSVEELNPGERPCAYGVLQPGSDVLDGVPLVRVGDIENGKVKLHEMKHIASVIAEQYPRTRLQGGEVLITLVGAIGRTAIVPPTLKGANTARAVGMIPLTTLVNERWVEIFFRNPSKISEMTSLSHEVARKTLNLEDVRAASIALPPLVEQERIVAEVERKLSIMDEVEATVIANLKRAERLRQAILQRAFSGKLVPQDPADEPASVLLERIRAERASKQSGNVSTKHRSTKKAPPEADPLPLF